MDHHFDAMSNPPQPPIEPNTLALVERGGGHFGFHDGLFALALTMVVVLVYQPVWRGTPLWDDNRHLTRPELRSLDGLRRIWFEPRATQQYYPLTHSVFWIEQKLWGDWPWGYHLLNIALHVLSACLVLRLLRGLEVPGAYLAAAIFALHPVQVESVAWITELKNTLSTVFYLMAMLAYLRFDRTGSKRWYALAGAAFVLGLLSKTVTATLPAALLVISWWRRGRLSWRRDVLPLLPFLLLGATAGGGTAWVERKLIGAEGAEFDFSLAERFVIAGRAVWFYLGKLLWPADLVFSYPRWTIHQAGAWQYLFPLVALAALAMFWLIRGRTRAPLAAALYFGGTLFPVLGFFNVYPFRYSFVADHFQYLASLGIVVLVSAGIALVVRRLRRPWRVAGRMACVLLVGTLAWLSWQQSRIYADAETLYRATIAHNPDCWMAYDNLGVVLYKGRRIPESIACYEQALRLGPCCAETHANLANALVKAGRTSEAIEHYHQALRCRPDYAEAHNTLGLTLLGLGRISAACEHFRQAIEIDPHDAGVHSNLGAALFQTGQVDGAREQFRRALELRPDLADAHNWLGNILLKQGRPAEALEEYQQALQIDPEYPEGQYNAATTLLNLGRISAAIDHFREALRLRPAFAEAHNNLGTALLNAGHPSEAIEHYRQATALRPDYAEAHYNLGAALANQGRWEEAISAYERALRMAESAGLEQWADSIRTRLKRLRAERSPRESLGAPAPRIP